MTTANLAKAELAESLMPPLSKVDPRFTQLQAGNMVHPKSVAYSQCTSISSLRTTPNDSCPYGFIDPNEPKVIASFLLPYKVHRDKQGAFKIVMNISKHAILYGSLLQLLNNKL